MSSFQVKLRRQPDTEKNITPTPNSCTKVVNILKSLIEFLTATLCHIKGGRTHGFTRSNGISSKKVGVNEILRPEACKELNADSNHISLEAHMNLKKDD